MFVVDRVEFDVIKQVCEVGELNGCDPVVREEMDDPVDETMQIRYVSQHVVGHDHIGTAVFAADLVSKIKIEEFGQGRHATFDRSPYLSRSRIDSQDSNVTVGEVRQQRTVIAGDFNHEIRLVQIPVGDEPIRVVPAVSHEITGEG